MCRDKEHADYPYLKENLWSSFKVALLRLRTATDPFWSCQPRAPVWTLDLLDWLHYFGHEVSFLRLCWVSSITVHLDLLSGCIAHCSEGITFSADMVSQTGSLVPQLRF